MRRKLKLSEKDLPLPKLQALWKALDEDASGFIDSGELSRFLRKGAPKDATPVQVARAKLLKLRESRMSLVRDETDALQEKHVAVRAKDVPKALDEDLHAFGELFRGCTDADFSKLNDTTIVFKYIHLPSSCSVSDFSDGFFSKLA